ncbi:Uncharacterised protein [Mycobacteroides abscessus subsp. massiliense]|nr:Uncharacterised protein [Mycobacteroides abscessus subsp. massiliense]
MVSAASTVTDNGTRLDTMPPHLFSAAVVRPDTGSDSETFWRPVVFAMKVASVAMTLATSIWPSPFCDNSSSQTKSRTWGWRGVTTRSMPARSAVSTGSAKTFFQYSKSASLRADC